MKDMLIGILLAAVIVMCLFVWAAFRNASEVERRLSEMEKEVLDDFYWLWELETAKKKLQHEYVPQIQQLQIQVADLIERMGKPSKP